LSNENESSADFKCLNVLFLASLDFTFLFFRARFFDEADGAHFLVANLTTSRTSSESVGAWSRIQRVSAVVFAKGKLTRFKPPTMATEYKISLKLSLFSVTVDSLI
jgi:hypothetical protein